MKPAAKLRALLKGPEIVVAPGAFDALSARLVERAGFPAVYITGGGLARSCGFPDLGLLTMMEVVERLALITRSVTVPVIGDADTGYGNAINVVRTVQEFERAGVAALHLEDQVAPKRCGHYTGKAVIPIQEMVKKIQAACDARTDPDLVLIARTDARATHGLDEAIVRVNAYLEAGADVAFVEAPQTEEELRSLPRAVHGPLLVNMFEGGRTPLVPTQDLQEMGYRVVIIPSDTQRAAIRAIQDMLEVLKVEGCVKTASWPMASFAEREQIVGTEEWNALEDRYLGP